MALSGPWSICARIRERQSWRCAGRERCRWRSQRRRGALRRQAGLAHDYDGVRKPGGCTSERRRGRRYGRRRGVGFRRRRDALERHAGRQPRPTRARPAAAQPGRPSGETSPDQGVVRTRPSRTRSSTAGRRTRAPRTATARSVRGPQHRQPRPVLLRGRRGQEEHRREARAAGQQRRLPQDHGAAGGQPGGQRRRQQRLPGDRCPRRAAAQRAHVRRRRLRVSSPTSR